MARRASVRYWASRGSYCCWFNGRQEVLASGPDDFPSGPTYQAALRRFTEITALGSADAAKDANTARVVFSRSSVNGVTSWLKAHSPPLVG